MERAADQISANTVLDFASKEESDAMTSAMEKVFSKKYYILVKK